MSKAAQQGGFSSLYGRLLEEFAGQVREGRTAYGEPARSVREEIVRCVWFGGHFPSTGLATDDGRRLEVVSPGWWNVEGGPDFVRAEFLLEGSGRLVGDVEVHTAASGWYAHGHHQQAAYNDVALHVVMWADRDEPTVAAADGRRIPQLTLSKFVKDDLEELVEIVDPEGEAAQPQWPAVQGKYCGQALLRGEIAPDWLGRLLDAAGDHRILTRAAGFEDLFENHPREQILYERVAEALGYKNNRMPFMQLAGLLPLDALRSAVPIGAESAPKAQMLEAALFVAAGFVPPAGKDPDWDGETRAYCEGIQQAWAGLEARLPEARLSADHWQFAGTRPANYPGRRLAALAVLCGRRLHEGLFARFLWTVNSSQPSGRQRLGTALRNALVDEFLSLEHPYWSFHYALGGGRLPQARALVGRERATAMVVDVLIPVLVAHGRSEGDQALTARLHALWRAIPRRPGNAVTRRMEHVLFESPEAARQVVSSTRRQQGLHQLYRDCCRLDAGCERCVLYLAHRAGKRLLEV